MTGHEHGNGPHGETDLEQELVRRFLAKPRILPERPASSSRSIVIIRKEFLPFYFAIYDHGLQRYTELQYRTAPDGPLRCVPLPPDMQPPA